MQPNNVADELANIPVTAVGPGTLSTNPDAQPSLLDGVTEYEYVDLFNPLSVSFVAKVASSRPVNVPVKVYQTPNLNSGIRTESDLATQYGLTGFKNTDHPSLLHVPHTIEIAAGHTRRLPGNEAQVVLRQMVGHILQAEGKGLKLADPYERNLAEQRIIRAKGNISELMDNAPMSIPDQLNRAVADSNSRREESPRAETEFPDVTAAGTGGLDATGQSGSGDSDHPKV